MGQAGGAERDGGDGRDEECQDEQNEQCAIRATEEGIELEAILEHVTTLPPLDIPVDDETYALLPLVAGGLSLALARTFKIVDPKVVNPQTSQWERAFGVFDLLL